MTSDHGLLAAQVDQLFAEWDHPDRPGAALAVIRNGSIVYKRGYGCANLEYDVPITPSTVFHVASVSKQFTAFAIALLAQQGKLSLDDDIRKYLPEMPDFGQTIIIRHLVHHTSGLRDQWELLVIAGWRMDDVITKEHILKMARHQRELNFEPGQEHLYCNTGYTLMAEIVERVTGQPFREYTDENIFKPLGMTSTHFHDDHQEIVKNRAYSYSADTVLDGSALALWQGQRVQGEKEGGFKKSVLSYANVGATSLFTTVKDLARWAQNFDDQRVGGAAVIEQMHQRGVLNDGKEIDYAFGLVIGDHKGLKTVSHSGGDAGYRSHLVRFPDQQFAVAILSNLGAFNPQRLALQVADVYLADHLAPEAAKETEAEADLATYDAYIGNYMFPLGILSIAKEDGRLVAELADLPKLELLPESEDRFSVPDFGMTVSFQRDEAGEVTQLTVHQGGQDTPAKKIEPLTLTPEQLAEFEGEYYSDELGTTYTLVVEDGQLVAQHRRHDDVSLIPAFVDQFSGEKPRLAKVHFVRDKDKIVGFRLSSGRVRNLRFDKQVHQA
jgi:CubicO group peptidase (beta-lactamase class C family)